MKNIFLFLLIVISLAGCRSRKSVDALNPSSMKVLESKKAKDALAKIDAAQFNYNFLATKAKVTVESKGKTHNLSFNIRMKKDEKIWVSVTALGGIEVARALLTVDSVKVMDRINSKYVAADYNYISEVLKNEVDFETVQNILIGNYQKNLVSASALIKGNPELTEITGNNDGAKYRLLFMNKDHKLNETKLTDSILKQDLNILYGDFRPVGDQIFPFLINSFATSEKESVKLNVQYSKVEKVESLDFPFSVPKNYD